MPTGVLPPMQCCDLLKGTVPTPRSHVRPYNRTVSSKRGETPTLAGQISGFCILTDTFNVNPFFHNKKFNFKNAPSTVHRAYNLLNSGCSDENNAH